MYQNKIFRTKYIKILNVRDYNYHKNNIYIFLKRQDTIRERIIGKFKSQTNLT